MGCMNMLNDLLGRTRRMTEVEEHDFASWERGRPSLHPYARHRTSAGPIKHEPIGLSGNRVRGRVWMGMRKYGYIEVSVPYGKRWSMDLYSKAVRNAIYTAWRC